MWLIIWFVITICVAIYFQRNMTKNQQNQINSTIYLDETLVQGKKISRIKCPNCGNTELGYQMVNSGAVTRKVWKGNISTTSISSSKYAICSKCGTSFRVIRRTTPIINGIFAFLLSSIVCSIMQLIVIFVLSLLGIM